MQWGFFCLASLLSKASDGMVPVDRGVQVVPAAETSKNMDVFEEPTRTYSWRVSAAGTRSAATGWHNSNRTHISIPKPIVFSVLLWYNTYT